MEVMSSCLGSGLSMNLKDIMSTSARKSSLIRSALQSCCFMSSQKKKHYQLVDCQNAKPVKRSILKELRCSNSSVLDGENFIQRKRLAIFVSGGGSNFQSIHEATVKGLVNGEVVVLVTDKPSCGGVKYAEQNGISILQFPKTKSSIDGVSPVELVAALRNFKIDFVLLAGYLKLIPAELVEAFPRSILNVHPSLLPAFGGKGFYGLKVHQAVITSGARYSGPTIHFVDERYDTGRILAQKIVPVLANDTAEQLAKRVLHEEHKLYTEVVAALCDGRIIWREDGVPLIQSKENPNEYF